MFKKRVQKSSTRTRASESSTSNTSSDSEDDATVVRKKTKPAANATSPSTPSPKPELPTAATELTTNDAVTRVDILNQELMDSERRAKSTVAFEEPPSATGDSNYRGQDGYAKFIQPTTSRRPMDTPGPKKQSSNIKSTTVFDFARDICKDYKETGFCGYGDSCKFLHARDDFKAGWKLNRDWDLSSNAQTVAIDVEAIPFKCPLCRSDYTNPVKTQCGHYFCEKCFVSRYSKNKTCFVCGNDTHGIAKPAKGLGDLLGRLQEKAKEGLEV